ncbi:MAG: TolC family protein, partial [Planctomycetota bacterium]|nr:TolC family protein [Planctomycetota bacterium]
MNDRLMRVAWMAALPAVLLTACSNPFGSAPSDYGPELPLRRIRNVDRLEINQFAGPPEAARADGSEMLDQPPPDRLAGISELELTLEQARAWTLANNLDLRVALINPEIANQRVTEEEAAFEAVFFASAAYRDAEQATASAVTAGQFETQDFNAGFNIPLRTGGTIRVEAPVNRTETNNVFQLINPSYSIDPSISISQPLLRNAGRRANTHGIRVAALQVGIEKARTKLEVIRQLANADRAYWRLFAARQALAVAKDQYELAKAQLDRARRQVDAGRLPEIEVIRAEEGVATRIEGIIVAENELLARQRELKRIMNVDGLDVATDALVQTISDPDPMPFDLPEAPLVDQALMNRMEMLELELQLAIDASTIDLRKNQKLPLFTVDYQYRIPSVGRSYSRAAEQVRDVEFDDWRLGVNFEVPIGNEAANSRLNQAVLQRLQRLSTREARRQAIEQETLDAIDGVQSGWQRILAARFAALSAARTLDAEQRQFEVGRSTSQDVLDAATRLAESQLAE